MGTCAHFSLLDFFRLLVCSPLQCSPQSGSAWDSYSVLPQKHLRLPAAPGMNGSLQCSQHHHIALSETTVAPGFTSPRIMMLALQLPEPVRNEAFLYRICHHWQSLLLLLFLQNYASYKLLSAHPAPCIHRISS